MDGVDRGIQNRAITRPGHDVSRDAQLAAIAALGGVSIALQVGEMTGDEIGALLRHVANEARRFEAAPGPLTAQAYAKNLIEAYRMLRERERRAPRGDRGELLKTARGPPWTPARPTRLEDVRAEDATRSLCGPAEIERWMAAVNFRPWPTPIAGGGRKQMPVPSASTPADSTGTEAFKLTFVQGSSGKVSRRTLPWPFPPLVIPNAYRIDLIKEEGMSFKTREGRIKVLSFLLPQVARRNDAGDAVTRHGMVQPSTAGTQPPATDRRTSMVIIGSDRAAPSRPQSRQHRAEAQRSALSAFTPALPDGGRAIADICRNPKSP